MTIFLAVLKWIGIILLIILGILLVLLLLVLFVPIRYRFRALVDDPESHEEFPLDVLLERSGVMSEVSWFWGSFKVFVRFPGEKLLDIRIFGKSFSLGVSEEREEPEKQPQEEEEEEEEQEEELESIIDRIDRLCHKADYYWRVLTGSCGRRAADKIITRMTKIMLRVIPDSWKLCGTLGLSDPCLNGRVSGLSAILTTFWEESVDMTTQWELYRFDLSTEAAGKIVLAYPVGQMIPLVFDKDIRKVIKKLRRARTRFA